MKSPFIAIIDDDKALCSSLVDLMRSVGYRAEPFFEAETLLRHPNLSLFDCVITDVRMPGMNGLDLVRKCQELGGIAPVILITALADRQLDDEAIAVGAQCLLRKPLETQTLLDWVERSLSSEHASR